MKDCFYKPLTAAQSEAAFKSEYDFDSPDAIDFDTLLEKLQNIKQGFVHDLTIWHGVALLDVLVLLD